MSESVEPMDIEIEEEIDPGTETPCPGTSAATSELIEQGEDVEESEENQNNEAAEEEKKRIEAEKWKKRERDFWKFKTAEEESSEVIRPMDGEEILRELEFHKKMRRQVLHFIKKRRNVRLAKIFSPDAMSGTSSEEDDSEDEPELDLEDAFMPHPYPLRWIPLPGGKFRVYQGLMPQDIQPVAVNGRYEVDPRSLREGPRTSRPRM